MLSGGVLGGKGICSPLRILVLGLHSEKIILFTIVFEV